MPYKRKETVEEIQIKGNKNRKIIKPAIKLVEINNIKSYIIVTGRNKFGSYLSSSQR